MLKKTAEFSGVLNKKIKNSKFKNKHKTNRKYFTRKGKLGFSKIMTMIIKKSNKSIQNSLNDMQLDINDDCTITNSAYTQARAKLNYTAFKEFANDTANFFYQDDEYNKYKGFRILAVDGSVVILPNSDDIKKEFNPTVAKCQIPEFKKEVVQSRVSCLYDVLNGITLDASINNKINSDDNDLIAYDERTLAVEHLPYCTKNDLVVLDRGYPSYEMFVKYAAVTNFLMRIKNPSFAKAKSLFAPHCESKDIIIEIQAPKKLRDKLKAQNLPIKMKVRFVQVILDNGTVEVLATNILDNNIFKTSDFKELYAKRWGIETYYDLIKNRLSLENFTGLTALAVKQDFFATIFLTNYEAMLVFDANIDLEEKTKDKKYVQKVNKAVSINAIKNKLFDMMYANNPPIDKIIKELEKMFMLNTVPIRPNRKSKPRLDKDAQKSTIATNSINHMKRKKKNVGN